jgi:hypothetical protein
MPFLDTHLTAEAEDVEEAGAATALRRAWGSTARLDLRLWGAAKVVFVLVLLSLTGSLSTDSVPDSRPTSATTAEVLQEMAAESEAVKDDEGGTTAEATGVASGPSVDQKPADQPPVDVVDFLARLREKERGERTRLNRSWEAHYARERRLFTVLIVAGVITAAIAVFGVLLALTGLVAVAIVTALVAVLPGSGTVLLQHLWADEKANGERLERQEREHAELLDAIEFTLSLPSDQRPAQAAELARHLQERAFAAADERTTPA